MSNEAFNLVQQSIAKRTVSDDDILFSVSRFRETLFSSGRGGDGDR